MSHVDVAIVGAGPFGLSLASFFERGGPTARVFGSPMHTWRTSMPPDMLMRSAWSETSLASPRGRASIDAWAAAVGEPKREPLPLETFLRYTDWFLEHHVRDHDPSDVTRLERSTGSGFELTTAAGSRVRARNVVLALGVTPFTHAPAPFAGLRDERVAFAIEHQRSFDRLAGKRVAVVGAGQAGLESAGLAARAGADVEVLARGGIRWFADREPHHPRGPLQQRLYRLAYPAVGFGPPPLNRLVLHPDLFSLLPRPQRRRLTARLLRPGGSPWVRELVESSGVRLTSGVSVLACERNGQALKLVLDDGSTRDVDRVLLATGYRFDVERLDFVAPGLRAEIALEGEFPALDASFRSTAPGLFLVGYAAEGRFGPLSRFVLGTEFTSRRVWRGLRGAHGSHGPTSSNVSPS